MLKIYQAASFPNRESQRLLATELGKAGYPVTSRWLRAEHAVYAGGDYRKGQVFAEEDLDDVKSADCLIVTTDGKEQLTRGGRHAETGAALALGKPVIINGPIEQVFHYHSLCRQANDASHMFELLKSLAGKLAAGLPLSWN